jgi:hypothetical protein
MLTPSTWSSGAATASSSASFDGVGPFTTNTDNRHWPFDIRTLGGWPSSPGLVLHNLANHSFHA